MPEPITPAITAEEWEARTVTRPDPEGRSTEIMFDGEEVTVDSYSHDPASFAVNLAPAVIAAANSVLPDSDPRKFTWAMVDELREAAEELGDSRSTHAEGEVRRIADVIASFLPPRETPKA